MVLDGVVRCLTFLRAITTPGTLSRGQVGDGREKAVLQHVLQEAANRNRSSIVQPTKRRC